MKKIKNFIILFSILIFGTNILNAQAHHESFENFNCEYNCNSPCHNYFYDECIPNWYSCGNEPRILFNNCNTIPGVSASDGQYFGGMIWVRNMFYELPDNEFFHTGMDYYISYDAYKVGINNSDLKVIAYNDLTNLNYESDDNGTWVSEIANEHGIFENQWTNYEHCFSVSQDCNQVEFKLDFISGGSNFPSGQCDDPWILIDNIKIICQQNYDITQIDNSFDYNSCTKSRTFELNGLGNCTNDLTDYSYTVELYKGGDLINSFANTGNTFSFEFDLFDNSSYNIKVVGLNSEECGYTIPTYIFDLEDDFPVNWEIADNVVWDSPQIVNHDVLIEEGGFLTITAETTFSPGTRLIVKKGAKLVVDAADLTSICGNWEGIVVEGNSNLPQPNYYDMPAPEEAGIVVTQNNAIIENAHIGISTNYVGDWSDQYWGGVVHCENTEFVNCWKGVEFMKYDYENKGYFDHCTFTGWKEGVTIWACHGVTFNHCTFDDKYKGISAIDADFVVQYGNTFSNCDYGIEASATSGDMPFVRIEDNNNFNDNDIALDISGVHSNIFSNYFDDNQHSILFDADNQYFVKNNSFGLGYLNVISDGTGYNSNEIDCNDMYSQYGGIWMGYDNQKTIFLSNNFTGTESFGFDYYGWNADIVDQVGNKDDISAMNSFSGVERDIDSREENGNEYFEYFVPPNATADLIPDYPGNYDVRNDGSFDGKSCSPIVPPIVTKTEITILLTDYCYWWGLYKQNPNNSNYKWMFHQAERKFLYKYYWWYRQRYEEKSWEEIEEILKELCSDRWKVRLYGFYMRTSQYDKAEAVLNELDDPSRAQVPIVPEDLSDESRASFITVQRINLVFQQSDGSYQPTEAELNILKAEAIKDIPERAYARGLLLLTTGEKFNREISEGGLEPRESKYKLPAQWSVYPNPTNDMLYIDYNGEFDGNITIYDLLGSKMLQRNIIGKGSNKIDMDVSTLNDGVYLLIVRDSENTLIKSEKVIVGSFK